MRIYSISVALASQHRAPGTSKRTCGHVHLSMFASEKSHDHVVTWGHKHADVDNVLLVQVINLQTQQRTASFVYNTTLPDPTICVGTHSIVYSTINKQCVSVCQCRAHEQVRWPDTAACRRHRHAAAADLTGGCPLMLPICIVLLLSVRQRRTLRCVA